MSTVHASNTLIGSFPTLYVCVPVTFRLLAPRKVHTILLFE